MSASYSEQRHAIYLAISDGGNGYTVTIPTWWSIAQVERYLTELGELYGC